MAHQLAPLPYATNALEPYIDTMTMEIHHGKHHAAYVTNLNNALANNADLQGKTIDQLLTSLSSVPEAIRTAVRNNGGGHYNHTTFWQQLKPGGATPGGQLLDAINSTFTSLDNFKDTFNKAGLGRFGSGWAWLIVGKDKKLAIVSTPNQDNPIMGKEIAGVEGAPLLGVDVWEHAYYLKYQNRRADYLGAIWNVINWDDVAARLASALK